MRLSEATEKRAEAVIAAASKFAVEIIPPVQSGPRARFSQGQMANMARRARRFATEAVCLARLIERAAEGLRAESDLETEDPSADVGKNATTASGAWEEISPAPTSCDSPKAEDW